jgi:hypothetical protein
MAMLLVVIMLYGHKVNTTAVHAGDHSDERVAMHLAEIEAEIQMVRVPGCTRSCTPSHPPHPTLSEPPPNPRAHLTRFYHSQRADSTDQLTAAKAASPASEQTAAEQLTAAVQQPSGKAATVRAWRVMHHRTVL